MHWFWELLEAPATDVPTLRARNSWLAAIHLVLFAAALAVLALVVWRIRLLVTLTQRSNVETLLIGFIVVFLAYVLLSTLPATRGAATLVALRALGRERAQRWLQRRAERKPKETKRSYLDVVVRGPGGRPIEIPIEDGFGRIGTVRLELAEIAFLDTPAELHSSVARIVARTLGDVGEGSGREPKIVFWDGMEDEAAAIYASQVKAFDVLRRAMGRDELWPEVRVDDDGVERLRAVVREATPLFREDILLPDIEYSAEFSLPVVPEPLAFVQLRRKTQHADPVASMGCVTIVALTFLAGVAWVIVNPPRVPGK